MEGADLLYELLTPKPSVMCLDFVGYSMARGIGGMIQLVECLPIMAHT